MNLAPFISWMQQNHMRVMLTEFGGSSADSNCATDINWLLTQLEANAYNANMPSQGGFIGWTAWVAGHSWAMGDVNSIMPQNNQDNVNMTNAYSKHLTAVGSAVGNAQVGFGAIPSGFPSTAVTTINVDGQPVNTACNIVQGCTLTNLAASAHTFSANQLNVSYNNLSYQYTFSPVTVTVPTNGTVNVPFNLSSSQVIYPYNAAVSFTLNGVAPSDNTGVQVSFSGTGINAQSCTIPAGVNAANCTIQYQSLPNKVIALQASTPAVSGYTVVSGPVPFSVNGNAATPSALSATYTKNAPPPPPPVSGCVATVSASAPNPYWTGVINGKTAYMTTLQISITGASGSNVVLKNPSYLGAQNGWGWTPVSGSGQISGSLASYNTNGNASLGLNMGASQATMSSFIPTQVYLNGAACTIKQ